MFSQVKNYHSVAAEKFARATLAALVPALLVFTVSLSLQIRPASAAGDETILQLPIDKRLAAELDLVYQKLKESVPDYKPRTEHLGSDGEPHYINRLIREDSPYLLQHAHNPVNWYSWGPEAFKLAKETNRPIFLSIGYATCHWCHVMEREVFEQLGVAEYMNTNFVAIKVDREQHPDVDETFMTAVQMMTGRGGWPLSAWLTPEAKPFYGGTYFPLEAFQELQTRIVDAWTNSSAELAQEAEKVAQALEEVTSVSKVAKELGVTEIDEAIRLLLSSHDDLQGGFGDAPKFPREPGLLMLLEQAMHGGEQAETALEAASFTLERIAAGGIHDHVAGGFHRYAVDDDWLVPHFEKMLYNQAYLARAYLRSYQLSGDWEHGRVATRTLDYTLREMRSPQGTFYSATDADSDGGEGLFFIWTEQELDRTLDRQEAKLAKRVWRTTPEGNFEGGNILHMDGPIEDVAAELGVGSKELVASLDDLSRKLLAARSERVKPILDDKIIVGWNAMLITALTEASGVLGRPDFLEAATKAANELLQTQRDDAGELRRISFNGRQSVAANQSDYALLAESLVELFDATGSGKWLSEATALVDTMNRLFLDEQAGAYFMGLQVVSGAQLPVRPKSIYDNSTPSGNSVAARVLLRLYARTGEDRFLTLAEELFASFGGPMQRSPTAFGYMMTALQEMMNGESGSIRYGGRGHVRVTASNVDNESLTINVSIDNGWHINAHVPIQDYLIGTAVQLKSGDTIPGINYPEPVKRTLGFDRSELALYEGELEIDIPLDSNLLSATRVTDRGNYHTVSLRMQACDDTTCLAPEDLTVSFSTASLGPWKQVAGLSRDSK